MVGSRPKFEALANSAIDDLERKRDAKELAAEYRKLKEFCGRLVASHEPAMDHQIRARVLQVAHEESMTEHQAFQLVVTGWFPRGCAKGELKL